MTRATRLGRPAHERAPDRRKAKLTMSEWMAGHGEDADRPEPALGPAAGFAVLVLGLGGLIAGLTALHLIGVM